MSHSPNSGPVVLAPLAILRAFLPISLSASASFFSPPFYHYSFLSLLSICLLPSTSTELSPTITSFTKSSAMAILPFSSNLSLPIVNLISLASHIYDSVCLFLHLSQHTMLNPHLSSPCTSAKIITYLFLFLPTICSSTSYFNHSAHSPMKCSEIQASRGNPTCK